MEVWRRYRWSILAVAVVVAAIGAAFAWQRYQNRVALKEAQQRFQQQIEYGDTSASVDRELVDAVHGRRAADVERLIAQGGNVNVSAGFGITLLEDAAHSGDVGITATLIAHGAEVNPKGCEQPLHYAVGPRHEEVIRLLLSKGADVNAKGCSGWTALHEAVRKGLNDIAVSLILAGADLGAKDDAGQTPMDVVPKPRADGSYGIADAMDYTPTFPELFSSDYQAVQPSFDCRVQGLTPLESEICAVPLLRDRDRQLNDAYLAALRQAKAPSTVKDEQRGWLKDRDDQCAQYACPIRDLVAMYDHRIAVLELPVTATSSGLPKPIPPVGDTVDAKLSFLKLHLSPGEQPRASAEDVKSGIPYILGALQDPAPEVREFGASHILDESLLPAEIHVMAQDPDPQVRISAGVWLSSYITSNGAETCNSVGPVSQHVDEVLLGLADPKTAQSVSEVLGANDAGGKPLTCCMAPDIRQHVITALRSRILQPEVGFYANAALTKVEECAVEWKAQ